MPIAADRLPLVRPEGGDRSSRTAVRPISFARRCPWKSAMRSGRSTSSSARTRAAATWSSGATRPGAGAGSTWSAIPCPMAGGASTAWVRRRPGARRNAAKQAPVRRPDRPRRTAEILVQRPRVRGLPGRYPRLGPAGERREALGAQLQVPQAARHRRRGASRSRMPWSSSARGPGRFPTTWRRR